MSGSAGQVLKLNMQTQDAPSAYWSSSSADCNILHSRTEKYSAQFRWEWKPKHAEESDPHSLVALSFSLLVTSLTLNAGTKL